MTSLCLPAGVTHPLDPLTEEEIKSSTSLCRQDREDGSSLIFIEVHLYEISKQDLVEWKDSGRTRSWIEKHRAAYVLCFNRDTGRTWEFILSLYPLRIIDAKDCGAAQASQTTAEYELTEKLARADPRVQAALRERGVSNLDMVIVDSWCPGYKPEPGRRLTQPLFFLKSSEHGNGYARPIEGLEVVIDLIAEEVLSVEVTDMIPIPPEDPLGEFTEGLTPDTKFVHPLRPLVITQPEGASFTVRGREVEWHNWSMHVGFTPREGLVIQDVAFVDPFTSKRRSIAHRMSACEMVVPYGDPRAPNYRKNAFDAGEDGLGKNAHSLKLGCDCLGAIYYFDVPMVTMGGQSETLEQCICMHEEDYGLLYKHIDWRSGKTDSRRSRRLVLSFICTVANYEYGFYWYFYLDGTIQTEVKLTGILSTSAYSLEQAGDTRYGTPLAPGLYAPIHQHFFNFRLDMTVDGADNTVNEVNVHRTPAEENPRGNAFYPTVTPLVTEQEAKRDLCQETDRFWTVTSGSSTNRMGKPTAFKLVPGANTFSHLGEDSSVTRRAGFLKHHVWVTQYHPEERYAAGRFPYMRPDNDGLDTWTQQNRNIRNTDIVLWYTFGVCHVPRAEDWPIMPCEYGGFHLKPYGFFDATPVLGIPKAGGGGGACGRDTGSVLLSGGQDSKAKL